MVPPALVPIIGKKELRFTLKTGDKRVATRRAHVLSKRVHNAFNRLSLSKWEVRFMLKQGTLSKAEVNRLLRQYVLDGLGDFQCRLDLLSGNENGEGSPAGDSDALKQDLEWDLLESKLSMKKQQYTQHMRPV